jgi:hypothetical protein
MRDDAFDLGRRLCAGWCATGESPQSRPARGDDFGEFTAAVEWMGLQRHLKILGIFCPLTSKRQNQITWLTPAYIAYARCALPAVNADGAFIDEDRGNGKQR